MSKNYVIENFMTAQLGLSGNELVLFSILWKESEKGTKIVESDYNSISQRMGTSIPTMYSCMKKLVDRGFIRQEEKSLYSVIAKPC